MIIYTVGEFLFVVLALITTVFMGYMLTKVNVSNLNLMICVVIGGVSGFSAYVAGVNLVMCIFIWMFVMSAASLIPIFVQYQKG